MHLKRMKSFVCCQQYIKPSVNWKKKTPKDLIKKIIFFSEISDVSNQGNSETLSIVL